MYPRVDNYDLSLAFDSGVKMGARYLYVMHQLMGCSGEQNEYAKCNYFVLPNQDLQLEVLRQKGKLLEVYDLSKPKQIALKHLEMQDSFL